MHLTKFLCVFQKCILNSVATSDGINGAICAQGREYAADDTGFAFVNCRITGSGLILLGRAWRPYSRVVFAHTDMPGIIVPEGWSDWDDPQRDAYVFFLLLLPFHFILAVCF
jgi:pectin methylesterase-like acyl-CoA thioesterase